MPLIIIKIEISNYKFSKMYMGSIHKKSQHSGRSIQLKAEMWYLWEFEE